jgi:hypothetical protein
MQYTYKYHTPTFTRVLRYTEGDGWQYTEEHSDRVTMPAEGVRGVWWEVPSTPERLSIDTIKYNGDVYRLTPKQVN